MVLFKDSKERNKTLNVEDEIAKIRRDKNHGI
jgi:hypothetical protein